MTDRTELVRRAAELVSMLRDQATNTEKKRRLPQEIIDAFHTTGILRAATPTRFGGYGLDFDVVFDVAAELGRGCGSSGWCYTIWASHNWIAGMFPEQAQKEYWAESPDTLSSTSFNPARGTVTATDGGYRVSGRWDFASGCDAASWMLIVGNGPEGPLMLLVPKADYEIEDTWFVSGLRGTGSKDITIEDAFVPKHRGVLLEDMREARAPGRSVHDTANYRIPLRSILTFTLAAPIVGMAQGAVETFEADKHLADVPSVHMRLGEAAAEVQAARLIMRHDSREIFARAEHNGMPTLDDRVRYRRDQAYVAKLCVQAVNRLFEASGGQSLFDSNAIQRFHRDVHAASHHVSLSWDNVSEQYGRVRLGLEPTSQEF